MFMDPSAFEAEDIERELADAGIKPETKTPSGFHHGDETEKPPSSGSSYGLGPRSAHVSGSGSGGGGGGSTGASMLHPRAIGKDRGHQAAPTYGRHSIGTAGRRSGDRSGDRSQFSSSSPSVPLRNSSPPEGPPSAISGRGRVRPENRSFGYEGVVSAGREEEKLEEDAAPERENFTEPSSSSATGVRSRARVLAQQREIQRKRRQQALNAGGIRASDAASLSRGIISGSPRIPQQHPSEGGTASDGRFVAPGPGALGDADEGEGRDPVDEGEEGYSFSPSVKQFSAPRQVEGGAYTAFNSNPRHAGERLSGMSEFEHRPSSGNGGVLGDSDEDDNNASFGGSGGGGGTRRGKKLVPDMGDRSGHDVEESSESVPPGAKDKTSDESNNPRGKSRPDDWDDRHRPSTKSFQWGRGSGGEGIEGGTNDTTDSGNNNTWRSVGRDSSSPSTTTKKSGNKKHSHAAAARDKQGRSPTSSSSSPESFTGELSSPRRSERSQNRSSRRSQSRSPSSHHEEDDDGRRRAQRYPDKAPARSGRSRADQDGRKLSRRHPSGTMSGEGRSRARGRRSGEGGGSGSSVDEERSTGENGSDDSDGGGGGRHRERRHRRDGDRSQRGGDSGSGGGSGSDRDGRAKRSGRGGGREHQRRSSGRRHRSDSSPVSEGGRRSDASDQRSEGGRGGHGRTSSRHHRRGGSGGSGGGGSNNHRNHRSQRSNHHRRRSGSDDHGSNGGGGGSGRRHGRSRRDGDDGDEHDIGDGGKHRSRNSAGRPNGRSQEWVGRGSGSGSVGGGGEGKTKDGDENAALDGRGGNKSPQGGDDKDRAPPDGVTADPSTARATTVADEMEFNMDALDLSDMKKFLLSPCPRAAGVVQCYIRRNKTRANKLFPEYTLFMKEGDRFLMCSKKRPNNATSNYLVSMEAGDLDRNSRNFLGKLRANFVGTEFQVFDDGYNPREQTGTFGIPKTLGGSGTLGGGWGGGAAGEQPMREELGCVMYASNVLGSRGPRKMQVAIPSVSDDSIVSKWSELDGGRGSQTGGGGSKAIERVKNRDYDGSLYMVNKPPRWNDQVGAYVLNFYGRVTMASVKNFQLVSTEDFDRIILQFGRVAKDEFTMDFQFPISPFQAFAITLSSFDSKIACD